MKTDHKIKIAGKKYYTTSTYPNKDEAFAKLLHSTFSMFGSPKENDYQKACRLYDAEQFEEALAYVRKFKIDELDSNPYPFGHEKSVSPSISLDTYRLIANCYRHLRRYPEALRTLENLKGIHHNVLSSDSLQKIDDTAQLWKKEAEQYATTLTTKPAAAMG